MIRYFLLDYSGPGFELFGAPHLAMVALLAFAGLVLIRAGRSGGSDRLVFLRRALGLFILLNESGTHVFATLNGIWSTSYSLPLQMCGAMAWISGVSLLFGIRRMYPLMYFFGLGGALQGVITPDAGTHGFPHYLMVETIIAHSALVIAGLWVVLVEDYRPTLRHLMSIFVLLNAAALGMYFVNLGLDSNYLFVNAKPPNASIIDLMPEWPWYIAVLELVAFTLFSLLYLPFHWRSTPHPEVKPILQPERLK